MGLKTPQDYVQSLRDGRVTYWDGEHIADITTHPRFKVPIAHHRGRLRLPVEPSTARCAATRTEDGSEAHRIYQIPRSEEDLAQPHRDDEAHLDRHGWCRASTWR